MRGHPPNCQQELAVTGSEKTSPKRIFIAGCGRSGTTLLMRLMNTFADTHAHMKEALFSEFDKIRTDKSNVSIKRKGISWKTLPDLPRDIDLIYCVRHPFDVLTSVHPRDKRRRRKGFYVTRKRWLDEYNSLAELRATQPDRQIVFVRYEDVVSDPDAVQQRIASAMALGIAVPFSQSNGIHRRSVDRWTENSELQTYLYGFPFFFKKSLKAFCDEFDYQLPEDYFRSRHTDEDEREAI